MQTIAHNETVELRKLLYPSHWNLSTVSRTHIGDNLEKVGRNQCLTSLTQHQIELKALPALLAKKKPTMSNPRVKRPFAGNALDPSQRQITSFFGPRSSSLADNEPATPLRGPVLPANVQSNLLSVGMRVRKSVPEGYKTNDQSAFKLWTDNTVVKPSTRSAAKAAIAARELLPFCGINKVGGLDCQTIREDHQEGGEDEELPGLDDVPGLTMSQESADSTTTTKSVRKRFFGDEEVEPVQQWMAGTASATDAADLISPRSLAPVGWGNNARPMAIPRSRTAKRAGLKSPDQENTAMDEDFEDADFLVYGNAREMDMTG